MGVKVDVDEAVKMLQNVAKAAGNRGLRKLRTLASRQMQTGIRMGFASGADPTTGRKWRKRKGGQSHAPLVRTGTLAQNVHAETDVISNRLFVKGAINDARSGKGSLHELAGALFYGRKKGNAPMPGRPFAGIGKSGQRVIEAAVRRLIERVR